MNAFGCLKAFKLTLSVGFWFEWTLLPLFLHPILTGVLSRVCLKNIRAIVIVGGETAGNVHILHFQTSPL